MVVVDASATVHYLAMLEHGEWVATRLEDEDVHAPHLLDVEVANAIRRLVRGRVITSGRGDEAMADLVDLRCARHSHTWLVPAMWSLVQRVSPYDAAYVALAEALEAPLLTTDRRLARSAGLPVDVIAP